MKFRLWSKNRKFLHIKSGQKRKKNIGRVILMSIAYFALFLCFASTLAFAWFSKDLPTPSKIANRKPAISTKIYDRTGEIMLYETGEQKRTIVNGDQISPYLKDATIATEDANFFKHHGIDAKAITIAMMEKITGRRRTARGGSTVTQQYIKIALLTSDRSITRKIKEAILAIELEFMFKKDEILTMYLNEIPYGNATAGAEAASRTYFGKPAKDLTLAEAATLAAIPNAPTYYSPYGTHVDKLINRRNYVLDQMVKTGKISIKDADEAKKQDTTTIGQAMKPRRDSMLAPHFAMYVLEQIADEYGEEKIQKEGLKIITTLDYEKQKAAEQSIADGVPKLSKYNAGNAALVAVDPKNGQVLAMVGSKDYFDISIDGNVNVADSLRQPGSSFKPFAYATAFKKPEYSPSKIIYDFQTDFGGGYIPHNYNGKSNGPVTMRVALSNSLNIPAVKVMALAGMDNVIKTASDMGITTLTQRDRYGLSLVLGSGEVKPVEMAGAYSVFANGGTKHPTTPVLKITDSKGKTLYDFEKDKKKSKQVLDPQIAYEISSILSDNNARSVIFGARSALYFPNRTVAAKTGTTNDFKDAWTMGYTPSISVAVWTGNSNAAKMKNGADGSVVAAPIFHSFIDKVLADTPNEEFVRPNGIQEVAVEKYSNKLPSPYSQETVTDIFAEWQVPKEQDDIHKIFKVCKGTNMLAPDGMDPSLSEDRVLTNIHSEMPNNSNWEGPVRAWAEANGMTSAVPTETCDAGSFTPTISIISPSSGTVSGQTNIEALIGSGYSIKSVEFFIDDVAIGSANKSPYSITYDFSNTSPGSHKLSAVATDEHNVTARADIPIKVESSLPTISGVKHEVISEFPLSYKITWYTDRPTTGDVTYSRNGGPSQTTSSKTNSTSHSVILAGLIHGSSYTYIIQVTDGSQNSNSSSGTFSTLNSKKDPESILD